MVHNQLLCFNHIQGKVVILTPHCQVSDLLPIGCLIVVGDQAYHCCVVGKLNDDVGVTYGELYHTVVQTACALMHALALLASKHT